MAISSSGGLFDKNIPSYLPNKESGIKRLDGEIETFAQDVIKELKFEESYIERKFIESKNDFIKIEGFHQDFLPAKERLLNGCLILSKALEIKVKEDQDKLKGKLSKEEIDDLKHQIRKNLILIKSLEGLKGKISDSISEETVRSKENLVNYINRLTIDKSVSFIKDQISKIYPLYEDLSKLNAEERQSLLRYIENLICALETCDKSISSQVALQLTELRYYEGVLQEHLKKLEVQSNKTKGVQYTLKEASELLENYRYEFDKIIRSNQNINSMIGDLQTLSQKITKSSRSIFFPKGDTEGSLVQDQLLTLKNQITSKLVLSASVEKLNREAISSPRDIIKSLLSNKSELREENKHNLRAIFFGLIDNPLKCEELKNELLKRLNQSEFKTELKHLMAFADLLSFNKQHEALTKKLKTLNVDLNDLISLKGDPSKNMPMLTDEELELILNFPDVSDAGWSDMRETLAKCGIVESFHIEDRPFAKLFQNVTDLVFEQYRLSGLIDKMQPAKMGDLVFLKSKTDPFTDTTNPKCAMFMQEFGKKGNNLFSFENLLVRDAESGEIKGQPQSTIPLKDRLKRSIIRLNFTSLISDPAQAEKADMRWKRLLGENRLSDEYPSIMESIRGKKQNIWANLFKNELKSAIVLPDSTDSEEEVEASGTFVAKPKTNVAKPFIVESKEEVEASGTVAKPKTNVAKPFIVESKEEVEASGTFVAKPEANGAKPFIVESKEEVEASGTFVTKGKTEKIEKVSETKMEAPKEKSQREREILAEKIVFQLGGMEVMEKLLKEDPQEMSDEGFMAAILTFSLIALQDELKEEGIHFELPDFSKANSSQEVYKILLTFLRDKKALSLLPSQIKQVQNEKEMRKVVNQQLSRVTMPELSVEKNIKAADYIKDDFLSKILKVVKKEEVKEATVEKMDLHDLSNMSFNSDLFEYLELKHHSLFLKFIEESFAGHDALSKEVAPLITEHILHLEKDPNFQTFLNTDEDFKKFYEFISKNPNNVVFDGSDYSLEPFAGGLGGAYLVRDKSKHIVSLLKLNIADLLQPGNLKGYTNFIKNGEKNKILENFRETTEFTKDKDKPFISNKDFHVRQGIPDGEGVIHEAKTSGFAQNIGFKSTPPVGLIVCSSSNFKKPSQFLKEDLASEIRPLECQTFLCSFQPFIKKFTSLDEFYDFVRKMFEEQKIPESYFKLWFEKVFNYKDIEKILWFEMLSGECDPNRANYGVIPDPNDPEKMTLIKIDNALTFSELRSDFAQTLGNAIPPLIDLFSNFLSSPLSPETFADTLKISANRNQHNDYLKRNRTTEKAINNFNERLDMIIYLYNKYPDISITELFKAMKSKGDRLMDPREEALRLAQQ